MSEADGFTKAPHTKAQALILDAESNIQDGNGSVKDYAHYFRNAKNLTEESARQGGLLSRAKRKADWYALRASDPAWLAAQALKKRVARALGKG